MNNNNTYQQILDIKQLSKIALFAALIAYGAYFSLNFANIPLTLQDVFVIVSGYILGSKKSCLSVLLYLLAGFLGLPIFAGGKSGLLAILGPTGGFLIGFIPLSILNGFAAKYSLKYYNSKNNKNDLLTIINTLLICFLLTLCGYLILFLCGVLWLNIHINISLKKAFYIGVAPFIPFTFSKSFICVFFWYKILQKKIKKSKL